MPGVLPTLRRRRLAPVPSDLRSKATNFISISNQGSTATSAIPLQNGRLSAVLRVARNNMQRDFPCGQDPALPGLPALISNFTLKSRAATFQSEGSKQVDLVREQAHDRLALGDALDGLSDQRADGQLADLGACARRVRQRDGVGDDHFVQAGA